MANIQRLCTAFFVFFCGFGNFEFLDFINICEDADRTIVQNSQINLHNLGYEFHIYQKHEMIIW